MARGRVVIDLVGKRFGRLVVSERRPNSKYNQPMWLCVCDCGKTKTVAGPSLRTGATKSCGCWHKQRATKCATKHQKSDQRIYKIFHGMKKRCYNTKSKMYRYYGAKGVVIDQRWKTFEAFYGDMAPSYRDGLTIDRIDPTGPYSPDNCRWVSIADQQRNKRSTILREYRGKKYTITQLAAVVGIPRVTLGSQLRKGFSLEEILKKRKHGKTRPSNLGTKLDRD